MTASPAVLVNILLRSPINPREGIPNSRCWHFTFAFHDMHFTFPLRDHVDHLPAELGRHVDYQDLIRLALLSS